MFAVTPRTTIQTGQFVMDDKEQESLAHNIATYICYNVQYTPAYQLKENLIEKFAPFELVTREGKLTKRISKWLKESMNIELDAHRLGQIGGIISYMNPAAFTYDITDVFDWDSGDFGDSGSCFWGDRSGAKDIIQEAGGLAIRFYKSEAEDAEGCARAWLMPRENGDWVMFNAYGHDLASIRNRLKYILPDAQTRMVGLGNWGDTTGTLYINNEKGLLISQVERQIHRIDLEAGDREANSECGYCGHHHPEDEMMWAEGYDYYLCDRCYDRHFFCCESCEHLCRNDGANLLEIIHKAGAWLRTERLLCDDCASDYTQCDACDHYYQRYETASYEVQGGDKVCGCCIKEQYTKCDECDEYIKQGDSCECQEDAEQEEAAPEYYLTTPGDPTVWMLSDSGNRFLINESNIPFFTSLGWRVAHQVEAAEEVLLA